MPDQRDLFATPPKPRKTRAPEQLDDRERLRLAEWAAKRVPWVLSGALECLGTLDSYEEDCLRWYRSKGKMGADWVGAVEGWIWRDERDRVTVLARRGNARAARALRDPAAWLLEEMRAKRLEPDPHEPREYMSPQGGTVISMTGRRR